MELVSIHARLAAEIGREWAAHHETLRLRDPRLANPVELAEFFESYVHAGADGGMAFALRDGCGWRAIAVGRHRLLSPDDPAQEIILRNNIVWDVALLRPWETFGAQELMREFDRAARRYNAEMHYATVAACNGESVAFLAANGFQPCLAKCARMEPVGRQPAEVPGVTILLAAPGDGPKIVDAHIEELDYHHRCAPTQMKAYPGMRERQTRGCEEVIADPNGISLYAEADGRVIAVADGRLGHSYLRPSLMLPDTLIGFIRSVGTAELWRGRGVGTAISLRLAWEFEQRGAGRTELIYCPWNPLSSRFWPRLGYVPVSLGFCRLPK